MRGVPFRRNERLAQSQSKNGWAVLWSKKLMLYQNARPLHRQTNRRAGSRQCLLAQVAQERLAELDWPLCSCREGESTRPRFDARPFPRNTRQPSIGRPAVAVGRHADLRPRTAECEGRERIAVAGPRRAMCIAARLLRIIGNTGTRSSRRSYSKQRRKTAAPQNASAPSIALAGRQSGIASHQKPRCEITHRGRAWRAKD